MPFFVKRQRQGQADKIHAARTRMKRQQREAVNGQHRFGDGEHRLVLCIGNRDPAHIEFDTALVF